MEYVFLRTFRYYDPRPTRLRKQGTRFLLIFHHPDAHLISMPRRVRLSIPGIARYIIQRGNNRSVCFCAEDDSRFCLRYLEEFAAKFGGAARAGRPGNATISDASQGNLP